jgi:PDZ domain
MRENVAEFPVCRVANWLPGKSFPILGLRFLICYSHTYQFSIDWGWPKDPPAQQMRSFRNLSLVTATMFLVVGAARADEVKMCTASAQECERAIRQMLSGRRYIGVQLVELNPGLAVKSVVEDGPADRADLRTGDRLMAVNGKSTRDATIKDFKEILSDAKETGTLWIIVQRRSILKHIDIRMEPYTKEQIDKVVAQHLTEFHNLASAAPSH